MAQAENGSTVRVNYTGKLDDGTIFDSSQEQGPLEFTIGRNQVIPGFEAAVMGMSPGDSTTTIIPAKEAYGERRDDLVLAIDRSKFPENIEPKVDQQLQLSQESGEKLVVTVTEVSDSSVTLDANHPLAGKDLAFDIQLLEIA